MGECGGVEGRIEGGERRRGGKKRRMGGRRWNDKRTSDSGMER